MIVFRQNVCRACNWKVRSYGKVNWKFAAAIKQTNFLWISGIEFRRKYAVGVCVAEVTNILLGKLKHEKVCEMDPGEVKCTWRFNMNLTTTIWFGKTKLD